MRDAIVLFGSLLASVYSSRLWALSETGSNAAGRVEEIVFLEHGIQKNKSRPNCAWQTAYAPVRYAHGTPSSARTLLRKDHAVAIILYCVRVKD